MINSYLKCFLWALLTSHQSHKADAAISEPQLTDEGKRQGKETCPSSRGRSAVQPLKTQGSGTLSRPRRERAPCTGISMTCTTLDPRSQSACVLPPPGLGVIPTSAGGSPSSRAPERSRSLMVVTVTVWLGWSYCTDSVFAVTSRSSSSASSVQGGHRTGCQSQGPSKQAPAPPNPEVQCPPLLYGRVSEVTGSRTCPANVINDPTPPFVFQGDLRPPGSHSGQARSDTRSCCCLFPSTPSLSRPQKLGCLLRISLPRSLGLFFVSDPLTFRGT